MTGPRGYHPRRPQIDALPDPQGIEPADMAAELEYLARLTLERDRDFRRMEQRAYGHGVGVEGQASPESLHRHACLKAGAAALREIHGRKDEFRDWVRRMRAKEAKGQGEAA